MDMADKDDEFLDADEGAAEAGAKEKPKSPFASAFIMQILKWVLIIGVAIAAMITIAWIVASAVSSGTSRTSDRTLESPEYSTTPLTGDWYSEIPELRGETKEGEADRKYMYIIKLHIMYTAGDKELQNEIVSRTIQIQDQLLTWFSKQSGAYLREIDNREAIREIVKQEINRLLMRPILDIRFTKYEIPSM
jgi:flagellar basal body-associated protein FliL